MEIDHFTVSPAKPSRRFAPLIFKARAWWWRQIGRRIPRLVWHGDEVDVRIVFTEARLRQSAFADPEAMMGDAIRQLNTGRMAEIEALLNEIGVCFDRGRGPGGTDWEFDYSLSGPVNVKFIGRAKRPELRHPR